MNTRIAYGDYQSPEISILAGEFSPAQIRRLELAGWAGDLRPLIDQLGLARVGGRLYMNRTIPTLEPATNARVNAQQFYDQVIPLFARQIFTAYGGADKNFTEGWGRITDYIRGKKADEPLSTAIRPWTLVGSNQEFVSNWLRGMLGPYAMFVGLTSPLDVVLPRTLADIGINVPAPRDLSHDISLILMPAAWPLVTREPALPPALFNAMVPNSPLTPNDVRAALEQAQRFAAAVSAAFKAQG
jgi:hypothetical protein